jgi:DNA-binding SARP family transcriptional activator/tetratricopeptide (TPR) repeat protein
MAASLSEPAASTGGRPVIRAQVLGVFHLNVGDRPVERADWQRLSAERLVKLLLVTEGHCMPRELTVETLWPDLDPVTGRGKLRRALYFARRGLGRTDALLGDGPTVRLDPALLDLDLDRLRAAFDLLGHATRRSPPSSARREGAAGDEQASGAERGAVTTVLELGARPLLPDDVYEDWLVSPREHLLTRWQVVAMEAARQATAVGRKSEAYAVLDQILDHDPTDEAAHRLVIELYASEGRHHSARRQFELCRRALAANLDAEPSAETEAAYRRAEVAALTTAAGPAPRPRLVARQRELGLVEPLLDRLAAGRSAALIMRGPAGIGKTRLLDEVRELGRGAGWQELSWQAIESRHPFAFAPFAMRLGELVTGTEVEAWDEPERSAVATILPGLGVSPHLQFSDRSALVVALVAALTRLARGQPALIAIDDLPWLDEASIEVLSAIASGFPDVPILLAVTYRDEESVPGTAAAILDGLRRSGALELALGPLAERDIEPLVLAHLGGESITPELAAWLFGQSEGNPLFCIEVARDSAERGVIRLDNERWHATGGEPRREPPQAVRGLVATRIRSLDPAAIRLLQTAAQLGPVVGYGTLAAVLPDIEGGLIEALDSALMSGLLVERGGGYAFAHPLFRVAVESESGTARRATLHLALAKALAGAATTEAEQDPVALAEGCADPGPAAEHALRAYELGLREAGPLAVALGFAAGLRARRLFDRDAATSSLERATAIWSRLPGSLAARFDASTALVNLAELRMAADDEAGAEAAFRAAIDVSRTPDELASAYDRFSWLRYRHGDFAATLSLCDEAFARLSSDAAAARAVIDVRAGFCLGRLHRLDECVEHLEAAVPALEAAGDRAQLSQALDHLGPMLFFADRSTEGLAALERALALALDLHDGRLETLVRTHLAGILPRAGRASEARPHAQRGLELAEQMGDWYIAAVAAWLSAEAEDALGDYAGAARLRRKELGWLARIGGNPHNEALAHAHLANLARRAGDGAVEIEEADRARKAAAEDPDPAYAARIEVALTAERWSDVQEY